MCAYVTLINGCATSNQNIVARPQLSIKPNQEIANLLPREVAITALQKLVQNATTFGLECEITDYGIRGQRDNVTGDRGAAMPFDRVTFHYSYVWRFKDPETERSRMTSKTQIGFLVKTTFADKTKREAVAIRVSWSKPLHADAQTRSRSSGRRSDRSASAYSEPESTQGCIIAAQEITGELNFEIDTKKMQRAVDALTALGAKLAAR
jgi:hypothetical protein